MRNLKRALSLALASIMVLGMMVVGASATSYDDFSDKDKIVNKEAVTVLTTLNVINGKEDGNFDPEGIVTRAEMAKIICVTLNGGQDPALGNATTHTYTDTIGHWAEAYIEYCTQLGIVAGKGNGTFDPNATVTGTEAAKMLLVALGYNAQYEGMVGSNWAIATNVLANQNKLYAGAVMNPNDGLTRDNAAQMAYNALNAEMVGYTFALVTGNNGSITSIPSVDKKSDTLLSDKFGGVRVEGVVVRNEQTATNFDGKTRVEITNEDELVKVGHAFGDVATFETSTDASLLGTSVFFYAVPSVASPNNSEKAAVLGSVMDSGKNVVVSTTKYFDENATDFMDDEDIEVNADTIVFVDGSQKGTGVADVKALVNKTGCEVKFIDNDNDGVTEAVVQTNYSFGKVTKYSTKDDGTLTIDTYADSKDYKSAKIIGFDEVAINDYVIYNHMGGKLYVAKAETVEGTLETYKYNSNRLKANLTVDGTAYTFSDSANYNGKDGELKDPYDFTDNSYMGKGITLYLDKFGYVAAVSDVQGFTDYAYISNAKVNNDASGFANDVRVYATLADGTTNSYLVKNLKTSTTDAGKKPTAVDGGTGTVVVGNVYGYYVTSDGQIELTEVANGSPVSGGSNNIEFNKGSSTISTTNTLSPNMTDNNTVFFYVMKEVNASGVVQTTIKRVDTYVGKDSAPSIKVASGANYANTSVMTVPSRNNASIAGAVVFQVGEVASANVLYLYQYVKSTNENTIYNAVIDGKLVEGITVDSKATNLAGAPYVYTMTSKGYYNVSAVANASYISGYVTLSEGKSVVITDPFGGSQEVKITSDTSMAEIDGGDTAIITNVAKKDWVTAVYNPNTDDAMGIYLEERYSNDNASILAVDGTTVTKSATSGIKYDVATGSDVDDVTTNIALSDGATAKVTYTEPATLAAAKADAGLTGSTVLSGNAYIVVLSEDQTAYSAYKIAVGVLPPSAAPTLSTQAVVNGSFDATTNSNVNSTAFVATGTSIAYQWYKCDDTSKTNPVALSNGSEYANVTTGTLQVKANTLTEVGDYYFFCTATNSESGKAPATLDSAVMKITLAAPETFTVTVPKAGYTSAEFYLNDTKIEAADINVGLSNYTFSAKTGDTLSIISDELTAIGANKYARIIAGEDPVTLGASKEATITIGGDTTLITPVQCSNVYAGAGVTVKKTNGSGAVLVAAGTNAFVDVSTVLHITVDAANGTGVIRSADENTRYDVAANTTTTANNYTLVAADVDLYLIPAAKITATGVKVYAGSANTDPEVTSGSYSVEGLRLFIEEGNTSTGNVIKANSTKVDDSTTSSSNKAHASYVMGVVDVAFTAAN